VAVEIGRLSYVSSSSFSVFAAMEPGLLVRSEVVARLLDCRLVPMAGGH